MPKAGSAAAAAKKARLLQSSKAVERASAAEALGEMGVAAVPHLQAIAALLRDEDQDVRISALDALSLMNEAAKPHVVAIAALLRDECCNVRTAAIQALGSLGKLAVPHLDAMAKLLTDENRHVRYFAVEVFRKLGSADPCAVSALAAQLGVQHWKARRASVEALGNSGKAAAQYLTQMAQLLEDEKDEVRCAAVEALGRLGCRAQVPAMANLLWDTSREVRRAAANALGEAASPYLAQIAEQVADGSCSCHSLPGATDVLSDAGPAGESYLAELLHHDRREVRYQAARALCQRGESSLLLQLQHPGADVRCLVLEVLTQSGDRVTEKVLYVLAELLGDANQQVRQSAALALAAQGEACLPVVAEKLHVESGDVRCSALAALGQLGEVAASLFAEVAELLWDVDMTVRAAAFEALSHMGSSGATHLAAAAAPPCIDFSCAKSFERPLLQMVAESLGWAVSRGGGAITWVQGKENMLQKLAALRAGEFLSHIPCLGMVMMKVPLAEVLQAAGASFWPRSWCVPEVGVEATWVGIRRGRNIRGQSIESVCEEAFARGPATVIVKPSGGSQGKDIALAQSSKELIDIVANLTKPAAIIQEYIERPLLLDGFKWDARVYALVLASQSHQTSNDFSCFLARDGLARICVDRYEPPRPRNLHRITAHLTNYSLSKISEKYVHTDDPDNACHGSKRRLAAVLEHLEADAAAQGRIRAEDVWAQLCTMVRESVSASSELIRSVGFDPQFWEGGADTVTLLQSKYARCFHIIGLDVIIDETGKPWLLEINSAPSLDISEVVPMEDMSTEEMQSPGSSPKACRCGAMVRPHIHRHSPVDMAVKLPVVRDAFQIVNHARHCPLGNPAEWAASTIYRAC